MQSVWHQMSQSPFERVSASVARATSRTTGKTLSQSPFERVSASVAGAYSYRYADLVSIPF